MSDKNEIVRNCFLDVYYKKSQQTIDIKELLNNDGDLDFVIKKYPPKSALSNILHESETETNFIVKGPFGYGLDLHPDATGVHVLVAGGTGILPFLDLLDFMLKKSIIRAT